MSELRPLWLTRRRAPFAGFVGLGTASGRVGAQATAVPDLTPWAVHAVPADEPMRQLHAGGPSDLLGTGTGASGSLWALSLKGQAPRRIADGIDAPTPIATGHGRIAARKADGGLWVWEETGGGGRARTSPPSRSANLPVLAGLLILPLAVLAVVTASARPADPLGHRLARFEHDPDGRWREVARLMDAVVPDARPVGRCCSWVRSTPASARRGARLSSCRMPARGARWRYSPPVRCQWTTSMPSAFA